MYPHAAKQQTTGIRPQVVPLSSVPNAPRTPSPAARDLIFRYQGAQKVFLILGIVFAGLGALGLLVVATLFLILSLPSWVSAFLIQPLIFLLLGGVFLFLSIRRNRRNVRAFTYGRPALGKVVFAGLDRFTRINRQHPMLVKWEFQVGGQSYSGKISSLNPLPMEPLMQAQELPILYDPESPSINTVYVE